MTVLAAVPRSTNVSNPFILLVVVYQWYGETGICVVVTGQLSGALARPNNANMRHMAYVHASANPECVYLCTIILDLLSFLFAGH